MQRFTRRGVSADDRTFQLLGRRLYWCSRVDEVKLTLVSAEFQLLGRRLYWCSYIPRV